MAEMWYYTTEGKQMDAVAIKELKRLVGDGTLKPTDMVWKEGMPRWIRASSVTELFPDPTSALDQFFTSTQEAEKKEAQAKASGVTAPAKNSTAAPMPASSNNGSAPPAQELQGKKRKTSASEAEEDSSRPPRRRPEAKGGGSSVFIIVGLLIGGLLLLGALVGGVVILIFVIPKAGEPNQPGILDKDKKKEGPDGVAPINGEEKYKYEKIPPTESRTKTFSFKKEVGYEFRVTSKPKGVNINVFVNDRNGAEVTKSVGAGGDRLLNWTPPEDGEYSIEVKNVGGRDADTSVSIKALNGPIAKEEQLPKGVFEGKSKFTSTQLVPPKIVFVQKFRVKAGHPASFSITSLNAAPGTKFKVNVVKVSDGNVVLAADENPPSANPSVNFVLQETEIVLLRVHNVGNTSNKVSILYNVSP